MAGERPAPNDPVALARAARDRGHAALVDGTIPEASRWPEAARWLDRALRLTPLDQNIALALATVLLGQDTVRAASLFEGVATTAGVREAWQGLAAARHLLGDADGAATSLAHALSRSVVTETIATLAHGIVNAAGATGWCGLTADGNLVLNPAGEGRVTLALDGKLLRGTALPATWIRAAALDVTVGGRALVGSPLDLARIRRVVGCVEADCGGLRGWGWQPGNPDADPILILRPAAGGRALRLTADDEAVSIEHAGPLARPRGFSVPAARLAGHAGPWHVMTQDGHDLLGSPLDPTGEQRANAAATQILALLYPASPAAGLTPSPIPPLPPPATPVSLSLPHLAVHATRPRPVDVVVPVHGNIRLVRACLDSVLVSLPSESRVVVVDDASEEAALVALLDRFAAAGRIHLIRNPRNVGFPASANAGMAACPARDVVLLNSDTLVPPDWLARLREAACSAPDIGTATPLSNDATILSYPSIQGGNAIPDQIATNRLAGLAWQANGGRVVDIPVGVGFCLYIRRDCLDAVGLLRADVFAQGYGEENDFCLRGRQLGWRHVAVPGVFVAHHSGASFGGPGRHLRQRNERLLNRLHPGYGDLIGAFVQADPLAESRRRLDLARWRAELPAAPEAVLLVTHADGGGVERRIVQACEAHRAAARRPVVLRPARMADGQPAVVIAEGVPNQAGPADPAGVGAVTRVHQANRGNRPESDHAARPATGEPVVSDFPNLRYRMPSELPALLRVLRSARIAAVEVHHFLGHHPAVHELIARLDRPYEVHVHDYAWFCPRVALIGADRRYCGEPDPAGCEACIADAGSLIDEDIPVRALIERSARFLADARQVIAPSADAASRMRRHFPALRPSVVPHEDDAAIPDPPPPALRDGRCRVCLLGSIGMHKGYDALLACARDAAARDLKLDFIVVGSTIDDSRLIATGRVFVTGRYPPEEAVALVRRQQASIGWLPSLWPETWSLALTELWRAGLRVAAFDMGAPAERIGRTRRGFLLPPGLPAAAINNALVAAASLPHDERSRDKFRDQVSNPLRRRPKTR